MKTEGFKGISSVLVMVTWLLAGCTTTHTTDSKENLAPSGYVINQLVVVSFTGDDSVRQKFEEGYSERMTELGVSTAPSYLAMPQIESLSDNDQLQAAKAKTSADTSVLVEVIEESEKARATSNVMWGVWIAGLLSGDDTLRSAGAWGGLAATGAAGNYKMRVTLWNMDDDSLLWRIDTDSYVFDLASTKKSAAKLADLIHRELKNDGLIQ